MRSSPKSSARRQPALTDAQVLRLELLGRRIEAHFGRPQDIEWCLADDAFEIVQSRPITTLFPIPVADDAENHVYVSVGHQQMMTDAMKPLGLSMWQMKAMPRMYEAGGRLFVDVAERLASPTSRAALLGLWKSDPLVGDALQTIVDRGDFIPSLPDEGPGGPPPAGAAPAPIPTDPAIVAELIGKSQASLAALKRKIPTLSGPALLDFIRADIQELKRILFDPQSHRAIMAGMEAMWWLNEHLETWLGEKNAADTLTQSVPGNVTSEMGLALLDVADAIRPYPDVVAFLHDADDEDFLDELAELAGGPQARDAIRAFLDTYGMRCAGEIDITRPRWSERPSTLLPVLLGNVKNFAPGAGRRRFEQGRREAREKEQRGARALAGLAGRRAQGRGDQGDDRPRPDLQRLPRVSEVRHRQPLLCLQAGLAGRGRAPPPGGCPQRQGGHLLPHVPGARRRRAHAPSGCPAHSPSASAHTGPIRRSRRPGCSRPKARSSRARTCATTCRPAH